MEEDRDRDMSPEWTNIDYRILQCIEKDRDMSPE